MTLDRYVLDLEANDRIRLYHEAWIVFRREGAVFGVLHVVGDLRVGDEGLAGADLDFNADLFDSRDDSIEYFALQRSVDHGLEAHGEDRVAVIVDLSFFDALEPSKALQLLKNRDEVSVLYVAGAQHAVEPALARLTCC